MIKELLISIMKFLIKNSPKICIITNHIKQLTIHLPFRESSVEEVSNRYLNNWLSIFHAIYLPRGRTSRFHALYLLHAFVSVFHFLFTLLFT